MAFTFNSSGTHRVESCCDNANIIATYKETGVAWPDGVRRWNRGPVVKYECAKCGRELHFERVEE
ncbi:hypothetical protein SPX_43580 [Sporomusa paucivorans]